MRKLLGLFAAVATLGLAACTDPDGARSALLDAGYTHVEIGGHDMWACGEKDLYSTRFTAIGPTGRVATGVVCAGTFKGKTIRLD